jgi:hypothetical protein
MTKKDKRPMERWKKCTVGLDEDLWQQGRIRALEEGRDFQDLVADALSDYLKRKRGKEGAR